MTAVVADAPAPRDAARPLDAINFFLADVRDGLGPYLAIFLLARGWEEASIGLVLTVAGIAGIALQTPAGAFVDRTRHKRLVLVVAAAAITLASLAIPLASGFAAITALQTVAGIAGTLFPPAIAAVTLGIVGPKAFARRVGRNEAFNHAGNATAAALAFFATGMFGAEAVFWLMAVMALLSIAATLSIPGDAIDHDLARGLEHAAGEPDAPSGFSVLLRSRPLLAFAAFAALFHFANAAMLPLVGQRLAIVVGKDQGASLVAICVFAAQVVMVPVAIVVGRTADRWGRKPILLFGTAVLALRGVLYPLSDDPIWLVGVQCLDGIGAGILGALFPLVVADLTKGTGHFNVSQGAITAVQGIGASLSAGVAGAIIGATGTYAAAFFFLGGVAAVAFLAALFLLPEPSRVAPSG